MEEKLYLCSHCKKYKPAKEFTKSTKNKHRDMLNNSCKECYKTFYNDNRKIDSSKGYTKDNIQLVCAAANMMKGYMEYNDLIHFCEAIIKNKNYA